MRRPAAALFTFLLMSVFLFSVTAFGADVIKVGGVGSALETMRHIAQAFEKANPGIKVEVVPSLGSTGGIKALINGAIDIGLSGRPLKEGEKAQGAVELKYAETPFIFVTNNVSATGLTTKELTEIYEGIKQTWPDKKQIRLVIRPEKDSDTEILKAISPEMNKAVKAGLLREGMIIGITDQENIDKILKTPDSLGATTLAQIVSEKISVRVLAFNGVNPGVKTASDGSYPHKKPFYLIASESKTSEAAQRLITFIFSPQGQKILSSNGNIVVERKKVK